jgi:hypothetical protein
MPESKLTQHGGTRAGAGRKIKHADGNSETKTRISRIALNQLDALRRNAPKASRADVLERIIQAEHRRVFCEGALSLF